MTAAILEIRPAAPPGIVPPQGATTKGATTKGATTNLVRLFALDCLPAGRRTLVCHWRRDADGRLACTWEPDIVVIPNR
jgi:hypothetical protein